MPFGSGIAVVRPPLTLAGTVNPQLTVRGIGGQGELDITSDSGNASISLDASGTQQAAIGCTGDQAAISRVNIDGTRYSALASEGIWLAVHSAPADGDLSAGELILWYDQTNGAAKLMVKAKQADGTVKTGSVNLA